MNFFVNSKNVYYISEYLSGVSQANQERLTHLIIETRDKNFIQSVMNDNVVKDILDKEYYNMLKESIE